MNTVQQKKDQSLFSVVSTFLYKLFPEHTRVDENLFDSIAKRKYISEFS